MPFPATIYPYPLSGTVTRDVTVVIVNGTQFATLSVDGESFEVDLSPRDGRHPLRNRGR